MRDISGKLEELGTTMKTQFNLLATGDMRDRDQLHQLQVLAMQGRDLQVMLAEAFNIDVTAPADTLAKILSHAASQNLPGTDGLREALTQFIAIQEQLPENTCPTIEG